MPRVAAESSNRCTGITSSVDTGFTILRGSSLDEGTYGIRSDMSNDDRSQVERAGEKTKPRVLRLQNVLGASPEHCNPPERTVGIISCGHYDCTKDAAYDSVKRRHPVPNCS